MDASLRDSLIAASRKRQTTNDPSHDFQHVLRVMNMAEKIGRREQADLDILIPAALFHDVVIYQKDTPASKNETEESAELAVKILTKIKQFPRNKIEAVALCIRQCSFSKQIQPDLLEAMILQDADRLEATGAISIMRTFSSGGQMHTPFYPPDDPFCEKGFVRFRSALDLFYDRLLLVEKTMHTRYAKRIAKRRTTFLKKFLHELRLELQETGVFKN